jgi:hypothetical protein
MRLTRLGPAGYKTKPMSGSVKFTEALSLLDTCRYMF